MFDGQTTSEEVIEAFKPHIKGKTFVLIGAGYPSIGSQMATYLAGGSPAHILIASRTASKVEPLLKTISEIDNSVRTTFVQVDTTDHDSVRKAASQILEAAPKIDVLIHSAGAMATKEYTLDKQGIEFQLSANHVGGFLLTNLLVPALLAAGESRFVNLTSSGYRLTSFRFDDWNFSGGEAYDPWTGYGQAKTANVLFAYGLGKRLKHRGLTATVVHPGYNVDTKLGAHLTWEDYGLIDGVMRRNRGIGWEWDEPRFKTFSQIASTSLIAALDPELPAQSPAFLQNSQVREPEEHATDPESVEKLWKLSEELVKQKFEY
ncbi:NAD(P)-binding protein [Xylaria cf. heliscus]|nr:NAD(P)-binding protein [Xylaria cf. heliscus]